MADEEEDVTPYRWLDPPPTYVDHFNVAVFSRAGILRMSFGEWVTRRHPPIYRVGLAMSLRDARILLRELGDAIKDYDDKETARTQIKEE